MDTSLKLSVTKQKRATYNGFISKHRMEYLYNRFLKHLRLLRRSLFLLTGNVFYEIYSFIVIEFICKSVLKYMNIYEKFLISCLKIHYKRA